MQLRDDKHCWALRHLRRQLTTVIGYTELRGDWEDSGQAHLYQFPLQQCFGKCLERATFNQPLYSTICCIHIMQTWKINRRETIPYWEGGKEEPHIEDPVQNELPWIWYDHMAVQSLSSIPFSSKEIRITGPNFFAQRSRLVSAGVINGKKDEKRSIRSKRSGKSDE